MEFVQYKLLLLLLLLPPPESALPILVVPRHAVTPCFCIELLMFAVCKEVVTT